MPILPLNTWRMTPSEHRRAESMSSNHPRKRLARWVLGLSVMALLLGVSSIPSIGVYIMIGTLPCFALGMALDPSRAHRWIGAGGMTGALAGVALLVYFIINFE